MVLTEGQIKAFVRTMRKKSAAPPMVFALRTDGQWTGVPQLNIDGQPHRVAYCQSSLELRELMRAARNERLPLVALCPFGNKEVEDDVLARLARRRIHPPDIREVLMSLFQASAVDPRVFGSGRLAQALIEQAPADGYPVVPSGVLDLQSAWEALLARTVGTAGLASGVGRFLEATLDAVVCERLAAFGSDLRRDFFGWAAINLDPSMAWMAHLVESNRTTDLAPMGLLLDVLFSPETGNRSFIKEARVRLESRFAHHSIDEHSARTWAAAARTVVHRLLQHPNTKTGAVSLLERFDELLQEFRISELAARSDFSPMGFEKRLSEFGRHLASGGEGSSAQFDLKTILAGIEALNRYVLAGDQRRRIDCCRMAARLGAWLAGGALLRGGANLGGHIDGYVRQGGFVDWARTVVAEGDASPALNEAFKNVLARVRQVTTPYEAEFALRLADWIRDGARPSSAFLPVENVLSNVIGPLAAQSPVLLLVMDGMSVPVFRELLADVIDRARWIETRPAEPALPQALLAAVPSITEISRRALFRGALRPESSPTEQSAFGANEALFSQAGGQVRPALFLKGDLQQSGESGLPAPVRSVISNKKCRVVALVLNAIDEHLSGSDQIAPTWNLDYLRPLREVLQVAADAGRTLVLTSDHGHVLEQGTKLHSGVGVGGDRFRRDGGAPREGEITLRGERVRQAIGESEVTVAWSRDIRYAGKRRGYHGGASVQEMVIPLAVLRHLGSEPSAGWSDVTPSPYVPDWWRLAPEPLADVGATADTKLVAGLELFAHATAQTRASNWIEQVLDSEVYASQCGHAVRGAMDRKLVTEFLDALSARGGTMTREALAERLEQPLARINGLVANLARVFNVDGFEIVALDSTSGTVRLNVALLKQQFGLED